MKNTAAAMLWAALMTPVWAAAQSPYPVLVEYVRGGPNGSINPDLVFSDAQVSGRTVTLVATTGSAEDNIIFTVASGAAGGGHELTNAVLSGETLVLTLADSTAFSVDLSQFQTSGDVATAVEARYTDAEKTKLARHAQNP